MVSGMTNVPSEFIFNIMYKMLGFPTQRASYAAEDLSSLLRMLRRAENISVDTTEMLVIHQVMPDGTVLEVLDHDVAKNPPSPRPSNVVPIRPLPQPSYEQESIIDAVGRVLEKAKRESRKLVPLKHRVKTGFGLYAYEARSGNEYEQ